MMVNETSAEVYRLHDLDSPDQVLDDEPRGTCGRWFPWIKVEGQTTLMTAS